MEVRPSAESRWLPVSALVLLGAAACASTGAEIKEVGPKRYELSCRAPLTRCLREFGQRCAAHGYNVLVAGERISRTGPVQPVAATNVESYALVRCRNSEPLIGPAEPWPPEAEGTDESLHPMPPARCFPGATQACIGPGGCRGGQTCAEDGLSFGVCRCISEPPPPASEGGGSAPGPDNIAPAPSPDGAPDPSADRDAPAPSPRGAPEPNSNPDATEPVPGDAGPAQGRDDDAPPAPSAP